MHRYWMVGHPTLNQRVQGRVLVRPRKHLSPGRFLYKGQQRGYLPISCRHCVGKPALTAETPQSGAAVGDSDLRDQPFVADAAAIVRRMPFELPRAI